MNHFERETCTRCGGSGKYSYCHQYADRCFKCRGSGVTLTKRGAVAKAYFEDLCTVLVSEVTVGDGIVMTDFTNSGSMFRYVSTIIEIIPRLGRLDVHGNEVQQSVLLKTEHASYGVKGIVWPYRDDSKIRVYRKTDHKKHGKSTGVSKNIDKDWETP